MSDKMGTPLGEFFRFAADRARGRRSTAVAPILTLNATLGGVLLILVTAQAPNWLLVAFTVFFGIAVAVCCISMTVLLFTKPDLLRSESFVLAREAMERGYTGDSVIGLARTEEALDIPPQTVVPLTKVEPKEPS